MPKKKNNPVDSYNIDDGTYGRYKDPITGKVEGIKRKSIKVGRNEICRCGSGKKYKNCCNGKRLFFRKRRGFLKRLFNIR